jgi:drug/metabolite transporter (DMT)-like permease
VPALQRTTATRVANTITVNPLAAGLLANQLVGEPIAANLIIGLVAVFAGIWLATTRRWKRPGPVASSSAATDLMHAEAEHNQG